MKVLLVRHAQSDNNIVQADVHMKMRDGEITAAEAQAEWLASRKEDPGLSPEGLEQTLKLAKHLSHTDMVDEKARIKFFTSPMRRACQTAKAIAGSLKGCHVEVHPNLYEVGGIYRAQAVRQGSGPIEYAKVPGKGMTRKELEATFPGLDTHQVPPTGPWDGGKGFESTADAIRRAADVGTWLRSKELHAEVGEDGLVVLVSHADFLALLLANLHNDTTAASDSNPDFDVSYHGVSEQQMQANMMTMQQDYAKCVFAKYKVSLASTSLIDIDNNGTVTVHWMSDKSYLTSKKKCCIQ